MNDEAVTRGVRHLEAAAVEVVAALRAFVEAAEEMVRPQAPPPPAASAEPDPAP